MKKRTKIYRNGDILFDDGVSCNLQLLMMISDIQRKERQNKINEDENVQTVEHVVHGLNLTEGNIRCLTLHIYETIFIWE